MTHAKKTSNGQLSKGSLDLSKLSDPPTVSKTIDPVKIFRLRPSSPTPDSEKLSDLWHGQATALSQWHGCRDKSDVLLSLNTGAGKTIIGLLIAQSLVNEGQRNVVYVCSTIDLVKQTFKEAKKIGLSCTTRIGRDFSSNDFDTGKSFCVTTYHALFTGFSVFSGGRFPGAVIFDDAHVAGAIIRDCYTLRISSHHESSLFAEIAQLFEPVFSNLNEKGRFYDSCESNKSSAVLVPLGQLYANANRLVQILRDHDIENHDNLKYRFELLKDRVSLCAATFVRGTFELGPIFLPSLAIDIFSRPIRRVYLSATLRSSAEFIRAFGRRPQKTICPSDTAGEGERLIVSTNFLGDNESVSFIDSLQHKHKVLISVPSKSAAEKWNSIAVPPERNQFSEMLEEFRNGDSRAFILVARVDGIDLPGETCRLMAIEDVTGASSGLDTFQWSYLHMHTAHSEIVANRVTQLFGRINRGKADFGVFLLIGKRINDWLENDRNVALLPDHIQRQVLYSRYVQEKLEIDNVDGLLDIISRVMNRDEDWVNNYSGSVESLQIIEEAAEFAQLHSTEMANVAELEMKVGRDLWINEVARAREQFERRLVQTEVGDTLLSGWHNFWLGGLHDVLGDSEASSQAYRLARARSSTNLVVPTTYTTATESESQLRSNFSHSLRSMGFGGPRQQSQKSLGELKMRLTNISELSSSQAEEVVRELGEILGFTSHRPDNDCQIGPDVLWIDQSSKTCLGFELKTLKAESSMYDKNDIGQCLQHEQWIRSNYCNLELLSVMLVGPPLNVSPHASPTQAITFCSTKSFDRILNRVLAFLDDLTNLSSEKQREEITDEVVLQRWRLENIFEKLDPKNLDDL